MHEPDSLAACAVTTLDDIGTLASASAACTPLPLDVACCCHSQMVEEAAVEEVEEFEAIEKLETLGVNRGENASTCLARAA